MLVNLRDICAIAEQKNMAIASFNDPRATTPLPLSTTSAP